MSDFEEAYAMMRGITDDALDEIMSRKASKKAQRDLQRRTFQPEELPMEQTPTMLTKDQRPLSQRRTLSFAFHESGHALPHIHFGGKIVEVMVRSRSEAVAAGPDYTDDEGLINSGVGVGACIAPAFFDPDRDTVDEPHAQTRAEMQMIILNIARGSIDKAAAHARRSAKYPDPLNPGGSMSPFDFPNGPKLDDWPDLRDMSRVDVAALVQAMAIADVVVTVYPEGDYTILRGKQKLRRIGDCGEDVHLSFLILRVSNTPQAEILATALSVAERGRMTPAGIETIRAMLTGVQDMSGRTN
jgi:hypothetical protein